MNVAIKTLQTLAIVVVTALFSTHAVAQTATGEPAKIVKLKSRCSVDTRLIQMAVGNKAREAMAAAGYSKVVVSVNVKPEQNKPVNVTAANVLGLSAVKLASTTEPKFTIDGGTAAQPLETSCTTQVAITIRASGVKGTQRRVSSATISKLTAQGVFR